MKQFIEKADSDPRTIEEFHDLLQDNCKLEVLLVKKSANRSVIQVNDNNPESARKWFAKTLLPRLGLDFEVPRFTKKTRYMILLHPKDEPETSIPIVFKKGGDLRAGRANEKGLQNFVNSKIQENGVCHMKFSDNYGKVVELDIIEVMDMAANKGKANRSDTTFKLEDGSLYGVSQKKTNATYACKCLKALKEILPEAERRIRTYIRDEMAERNPGDYFSIRVTNREFINLCWFGTDISKGGAFIGDFENIDSEDVQVERIIENGDTNVLDSFPLYACWKVLNKSLTLALAGISVRPMGKFDIVKDIELPGFNAPMKEGRRFRVTDEPKRKHRRRRRRVSEDLISEQELMEEARKNDMWDTVAFCAENHKMLWLKYETVEDAEIISRKVAPYSYRTRNTKARGRSTYFYADDFTPGQEHGIKCFLIDNCLDVKESRQSFTPKFPVEIKQEIDRLEKQRQDDEEKKEREEKVDKERPDVGNDNEVLNADKEQEVKDAVKKGSMNRDAEQKQKEKPKVVPPKPQKPAPVKPPKPMKPATSTTPTKKDDDNKSDVKSSEPKPNKDVITVTGNDKPKEEPPPQDIEEPDETNTVELGDDDEVGIVVTNDEGEQVDDQK